MGKPQKSPYQHSKSVLVIEVVRDLDLRPKWWTCVISIPGHPGAFSRTYETPVGILDDATLTDLSHWLLQTVQNTIYASCGVQTMLGEPHPEPAPPVSAGGAQEPD